MTLGELTTQLQTLCHEGHANELVVIKLYNAPYFIKKVEQFQMLTRNEQVTTLIADVELRRECCNE